MFLNVTIEYMSEVMLLVCLVSMLFVVSRYLIKLIYPWKEGRVSLRSPPSHLIKDNSMLLHKYTMFLVCTRKMSWVTICWGPPQDEDKHVCCSSRRIYFWLNNTDDTTPQLLATPPKSRLLRERVQCWIINTSTWTIHKSTAQPLLTIYYIYRESGFSNYSM